MKLLSFLWNLWYSYFFNPNICAFDKNASYEKSAKVNMLFLNLHGMLFYWLECLERSPKIQIMGGWFRECSWWWYQKSWCWSERQKFEHLPRLTTETRPDSHIGQFFFFRRITKVWKLCLVQFNLGIFPHGLQCFKAKSYTNEIKSSFVLVGASYRPRRPAPTHRHTEQQHCSCPASWSTWWSSSSWSSS